jgi:hypothetical protein
MHEVKTFLKPFLQKNDKAKSAIENSKVVSRFASSRLTSIISLPAIYHFTFNFFKTLYNQSFTLNYFCLPDF